MSELRDMSSIRKTADVIIIGAGMSGLAAADHLHTNGIDDVVILEASNRLDDRHVSFHSLCNLEEPGLACLCLLSFCHPIYRQFN